MRTRLLREAAGNPLALWELPQGLNAGQLAAVAPLPHAVPLTSRLRGLFEGRVASLPEATRTALLIAAADNTGELAPVLRAGADLGIGVDALGPAEETGLISTWTATLAFRHPLVRSVVYEAATSARRQRAHAALAGALAGEEHADRRVWHQAMATTTGDEEVAVALEAAGRRAQSRAAHASAAAAFERAADLTLEPERLVPRLAGAAHAASEGGEPGRARGLISRALGSGDGSALRPNLLFLRGVIESQCGDERDAVLTLVKAAEVSRDQALTFEILHEAAGAAARTGGLDTLGDLSARAAAHPTASPRDRFNRDAVRGLAALLAGRHDEARTAWGSALLHADELADDPRAQIRAADIASAALAGSGLPFANRAVQEARARGLLSVLPMALEAGHRAAVGQRF